ERVWSKETMRLKKPITAGQLAEQINARLLGDGDLLITGLNEIHQVEAGDLCFVDHPKYYAPTLASAATVILIDQEYACPPGKALLITDEPFIVFDRLMQAERPSIIYRANVDPSAEIGEGTRIAHGAIIGPRVKIGKDCYVGPNAVVTDGTELGDRVYVSAGAIIGEEAFYFKRSAEGMQPWRSGGSVRLEDDVMIGPNCTVARGITAVTVIGQGTKLDAQVQIGHDCKIGKHCLLAAQVGIAGNTTVGDWCVFQGQVGVAQNLTIGDRAIILAKSGVSKNLEGGKEYFGYPAQEARTAFRDLASLRRLRKL
ncbi:MAG: UDP-3-O-(3-hydroxymyristoyl)glucosamine N-acyltransferase, partial [Bacteroidota bacterium]